MNRVKTGILTTSLKAEPINSDFQLKKQTLPLSRSLSTEPGPSNTNFSLKTDTVLWN